MSYFIPGFGFVCDTGAGEYLIPGYGFINEINVVTNKSRTTKGAGA